MGTSVNDPMVAVRGTLGVGEVIEDWTGDARFFEYSEAADPIGSGAISPIPATTFSAELYATGPTRGRGHSHVDGAVVQWKEGDFLALPATTTATHTAEDASAFYSVVDTPLLDYLGATASAPRFRPTAFTAEAARAKLAEVAAAPDADRKSRVSVLLNNTRFDQTLTVTHTLWAMFGVLPAGRTQLPHRHQSVAVDLIVDCRPGCYTLLGDRVDPETCRIVDPVRIDWEPGGAFVTPPGTWHSHHNETGGDAHLIPIQDAGLQTYLRSLDIRFSAPD